MNNGAFKRALGLTFLYIGLFVLVVFLQFSRRPGLSENINGFSVRATYPKTDRSKPEAAPDTLRLGYAGLQFELSPKSPAESVGADGSAARLTLSSIDRLPNGVRVKLSPGVVITATSEKQRFALAATAPDGVTAVRLRLLPSGSLRIADGAGRRNLSSSGVSYDLGLAAGSLDLKAGSLSLIPGDPGLSLAKAAPIQTKPSVTPSQAKFVAQAPKDPDAVKAEIAAWRDKVWSGLSSTRFDGTKIAWKGPDGLSAFSEKALAAYLAESLTRGIYQDAMVRVRGARDAWPDRLGYLTAPYFGGLVRKMRDFEASDAAEMKRLAQLIADKSPMLLEKEGFLRFLIERSPGDLAMGALHLAAGLDQSKLTVRQMVGLLGCAVDAKSYLKDEDNPLRDLGAAADRLVSSVRKSANGYFLVTEDDGSIDLRLSLLAGNALVAFGQVASKPVLLGVGQSLVEGVIGLADAQGFAPARVLVRDGALEQRTGTLPPEDIYPLMADNPYYPHEVNFGRDAPGIWAWTCSPAVSLKTNGSKYVFTARFPEGRAHFLSFHGIQPFANIQLYEIDYSPDSEFENYDASGYLYNKAAGALYLKMRHKKESEDIRLSF
jgi:hypothetical protein